MLRLIVDIHNHCVIWLSVTSRHLTSSILLHHMSDIDSIVLPLIGIAVLSFSPSLFIISIFPSSVSFSVLSHVLALKRALD